MQWAQHASPGSRQEHGVGASLLLHLIPQPGLFTSALRAPDEPYAEPGREVKLLLKDVARNALSLSLKDTPGSAGGFLGLKVFQRKEGGGRER